jgi:hypothetical protein
MWAADATRQPTQHSAPRITLAGGYVPRRNGVNIRYVFHRNANIKFA